MPPRGALSVTVQDTSLNLEDLASQPMSGARAQKTRRASRRPLRGAHWRGVIACAAARLDDGLLDVLVLSRISTPEFLRVFPKVFSGAHVDHPAVTTHRAHRVHLEATGIVGYADGERFAPLPLSCEVVPGALTVLT